MTRCSGAAPNAYLRKLGFPRKTETSCPLAASFRFRVMASWLRRCSRTPNNQNSMDADGGKLSLVRIGTGLRGAAGPAGPAGADGTGTGDIESVTTAATSGLAGGANSGDVALRLHINGLTDSTITGPDQIPFADASDSHASKRTTAGGA